jgi:hypothetical protein
VAVKNTRKNVFNQRERIAPVCNIPHGMMISVYSAVIVIGGCRPDEEISENEPVG